MSRQTPTEQPTLAADEVHVWHIPLFPFEPDAYKLLSPDERARAERFHFARDRERFVTARAALRLLLAHYTGSAAKDLRFNYGDHGKPYLPSSALAFNLAHAHETMLFAVAKTEALGIDIEYLRDVEFDDIAQRFFSPTEAAALATLSKAQKKETFYQIWTRKEAYIKACGKGLSLPLDAFSVTEAGPLQSAQDAEEAAGWVLYDLPVDGNYRAALAVRGEGWEVKRFEARSVTDLLNLF